MPYNDFIACFGCHRLPGRGAEALDDVESMVWGSHSNDETLEHGPSSTGPQRGMLLLRHLSPSLNPVQGAFVNITGYAETSR